MQPGTEGVGPSSLVLICDDVEPIRRLLRINLELAGFDVEEASDGHQAMARLIDPVARRPDVIVLDSQMRPYDGWWAIAAIRSHPALEEVPALLVTAAASDHARFEVDEAGFDGIVTKPFDPDELVGVVSHLAATGRRRPRRP
ncbi:response regulator [Oryzobacter terrae]|uniref:response regulator n=1 Tax=Oryzobacter terrae TaxID=1620385 RepID=UPI00366F0876